MPRIHDEDDEDLRDQDDEGSAPAWRSRLLTWGLAAAALLLGFLIPYMVYLNHQVGERFGKLRWQVPTRVYARPLMLRPGLALDAQTLKTELDAASYHDGDGKRAGTYARNGSRWKISSRGYFDVDGRIAPAQLDVTLSDGKVATLRDVASRKALRSARLDPARIATLYGQQQEERRLVRIEEVPELLVTGLQAVEDEDFAHHHGIDVTGMMRAAWVTVSSGGETKQGASTLTQQLARSGLARHRQGADGHPQGQGDPVRAAAGSALRQEDDPGGLLQPGRPGPARRAVDPWRGGGIGILVRPRTARPVHRADRADDRPGQGAVLVRPAAQPGARHRAPQLRARQDARDRS